MANKITRVNWLEDEDEVLAKIERSRQESLNCEIRRDFERELVVADAYISGEQYPEGYLSEEHDPYYVVNMVADFVDRLAPMIAGGRLRTIVEITEDEFKDLEHIARIWHEMWQRDVMLRERFLEMTKDMISFGVGCLRAYVDPSEEIELGGKFKLERVYPGQIWIDPMARDPFHPLLGSPYIGYDTVVRAGDLIAQFPDKEEEILEASLDDKAIAAYIKNTENSTIGSLLESFASRSITTGDRVSWPHKTEGEVYDRPVVLTQYEWQQTELVKLPSEIGGHQPVKTWYAALAVSKEPDAPGVVLAVDEIPYEMPTFVLQSSWIRRNSPYGQGIVSRLGDPQDLLNVMVSMTAKAGMLTTRMGQTFVAYADKLDPAARYQLMEGDIPNLIELEDDHSGRPPDQVIKQLDARMPDFAPIAAIMGQLVGFMENISGVHTAARGAVRPEKRTSGIAIQAMQSADIAARDNQKAHANACAMHLGMLGWKMLTVHRTEAMRIRTPKGPTYINQRIPIGPYAGRRIDELRAMVGKRNGGPPMIPNGIRLIKGEEEEEVMPLAPETAEEAVSRIMNGEAVGADVVINDMVSLDVKVRILVEADYETQYQQKMEALNVALRMYPGSIDLRTYLEALTDKFPEMDVDTILERLYGDGLAKQIMSLPPELQQQVGMYLQNLLQQLQTGAVQPAPQAIPSPHPTAQAEQPAQAVNPAGAPANVQPNAGDMVSQIVNQIMARTGQRGE